jgi:hypothetical protein
MDVRTTRAGEQDIDEDEPLREEDDDRREREVEDPFAPEEFPEADELPDEADFEAPSGDQLGAAMMTALLDVI